MAALLSPYPAVRFFLLLAIGLFLQSLLQLSPLWLLASIPILLPLLKAKQLSSQLLLLFLILAGMLRWSLWEESLPPELPIEILQENKILITERHENSFYITNYTAETVIHGQKLRFLLYPDPQTPILEPGKSYQLENFELLPIEGAKNPYQFDYRRYLYYKGITHQLHLEESVTIQAGKIHRPVLYQGQKIRYAIADRLNLLFGYEYGEFLSGLLLGLKERIASERRDAYSNLGLSHLLAVSGLHVGFIVLLLLFLADIFSLNRLTRPLALILVLLFYAVITGLSASVLRASLMTAIYLISPLFERRSNALNSLAATAFILLMWKPTQIYDVGFQFSFIAVFGILTIYPQIKKLTVKAFPRFPVNYFTELLLVSAAASLVTAPLSIYYFQTAPLFSIFLNLIFIPLAFVIIALLLLSLPFLWLPLYPGLFFGSALELAVKLFHQSVYLASRFDMWILPISQLNQIILALIILLIVFLLSNSKRLRIGAVTVIFLILSAHAWWQRQPELIIFSNRGAPIALIASQNSALIVNTGLYSPFEDHYTRLIRPALQKMNIKRLAAALSEADRRNAYNLEALMDNEPVKYIIAPNAWPQSEDDAPYLCTADTSIGKWKVLFQRGENELLLEASFGELTFANQFLQTGKKSRREVFTISQNEKKQLIANVRLASIPNYHHSIEKGAIHYKYLLGKWISFK
ncbi:MAG TPA: ComEC family competence protein [Candidatus Marinimicrobia bacterium]|mgnify:CR=1 FL=1|nr:ComEC family competence protein [Candidatus Neomarinimicrobiota bacterium]